MTDRTISIRIAADGKAFVVETEAAAQASKRLDDQVTKTATDVQKLNSTVNAASTDKFVRTMDQSVNAANRFTVSAAQTANAMRMLPAQITDVVTQLAGGQSPFLILVQQGGQVKDMFGGIGNTVRALGSLVTPTRLAMGLFAGVVTAAALAYHQGSAESSAFNRAIVLSGNVAGVSAGQLGTMARATSQLVGTQGQAAQALAALVGTGKVQSDNLQRFAQVSVQAQRSIGQEIGDTVAAFAELGKSPVAASLKLNESLNYLTAATYKQIKAAEDLGDRNQAASLAQRAYADALSSRSRDMEANLGTLERAWRSIKEMASSAWDAMLNVGRPESTQQQLDKVTEKLAGAQRALKSQYATGNAFYSTEEGRKEFAALQLQQSLLQESVRLEQRSGAAKAEQVRLDQARLTVAQALEASTSQQSRYADAIAKANRLADDAKSSPQERSALIAGVQRQYAELLNRGLDAQIEAWKGADKAILDDREQFFAQLKVQEQLGQKTSLDIIGDTADKSFEVYMARTAVLQRELELGKRKKDSDKEQIALANQLKEVQRDFDDSQAKGNADYLVAMNRRKKAIQDVVAAQLEDDSASRAKAEADRLEKSNAITASVNDYVKGIAEANELLALEVSLLGQSEVARNTAIAQYQEQLKLRRQELAIAQSGVQADQQDALLATVRTASAKAQAATAGRIQLDEFKKTVDKIDDVFRQGFADMVNGGTTTWKAFTRSLATTFKTTVADALYKSFAQPLVVNIVGNMLGLSGLTGTSGVGGASDNNLTGLAQNASTLSSLWSKGSKFFDTGAKWLSGLFGGGTGGTAGVMTASEAGLLGESFASSMAAQGFAGTAATTTVMTSSEAALLGESFASSIAAQGLAGTATGATGATGAVTGGGAAAGASGAMAVPIVGWIIAGMMAADGLFKAGYGARNMNAENTAALGVLDQKVGTGLLQKIGISERWANVITGAPLTDWVMQSLGIAGGESRGGGQYGYSVDGSTVYNPRRDLTYTAENQNTGAAIGGQGAYYLEGPDGGEIAGDAVKTAIGKTVDGINVMLKAVDSTATVAQFTAGLESSRKGRGGVFSGGTLSDGTAFGESGRGSNYDGDLFESTSTQDPSPGEALQNFSLDLQQVTLQALQVAKDTPKSVKAAIDAALTSVKDNEADKAPTIEELNVEQLQKVMESLGGFIQTVTDFRQALEALPFENLKQLSFDATTNLIGFAGGLDQLNASLNSYFTNFYSTAEQTQVKTDYVANALKELGLAMPDLSQGAEKARAQFRALVESVDPATEQGGKQLAALLNLQQAFADLTPLVNATTDALDEAAEAEMARAEAIEAAQDATDAALSRLQRSADAQRTQLQNMRAVTQEVLNQASAVFEVARSNVQDLLATVDSASVASGAAGQKFVADALATALSSGYLPDAQALSNAVDAARSGIDTGAGVGVYASQFEEDRDRLVLASRLEALQTLAGAQKTSAQLQLEAEDAQLLQLDTLVQQAKDQVDALRGIDTSVISVADAVAALAAAIAAEKAVNASAGSATGKTSGTGTGAAGGAVFGGSGAPAYDDPEETKYSRQAYLGMSGWSDVPVTEQADVARLDRLQELGSAFTGTGDVAGYFNMARDNGYSLSDVQAATGFNYWDLVQATQNVGVPMFAGGGDHAGGLRWVGEQGPELEATGASRIWNQKQLGDALRSGSDDTASELRDLRSELQAQAAAMAGLLNQVAKLLQQWDGEGMPTERGVVA